MSRERILTSAGLLAARVELAKLRSAGIIAYANMSCGPQTIYTDVFQCWITEAFP